MPKAINRLNNPNEVGAEPRGGNHLYTHKPRKSDQQIKDKAPDLYQSVVDCRKAWNHLNERQFIIEYHRRYRIDIPRIRKALERSKGA